MSVDHTSIEHREYAALVAEDPSFAPALAAARKPVMRHPPIGTDRVWVTEPAAEDLH